MPNSDIMRRLFTALDDIQATITAEELSNQTIADTASVADHSTMAEELSKLYIIAEHFTRLITAYNNEEFVIALSKISNEEKIYISDYSSDLIMLFA